MGKSLNFQISLVNKVVKSNKSITWISLFANHYNLLSL